MYTNSCTHDAFKYLHTKTQRNEYTTFQNTYFCILCEQIAFGRNKTFVGGNTTLVFLKYHMINQIRLLNLVVTHGN